MDKLNAILASLLALSLATERIVETIKGLPVLSGLLSERSDQYEPQRQAAIHIIAIAVGTILAYAARDQFASLLSLKIPDLWVAFVFGAMASSGSGLWNSTLDIVREVSQQKQAVTKKLQDSPASLNLAPR